MSFRRPRTEEHYERRSVKILNRAFNRKAGLPNWSQHGWVPISTRAGVEANWQEVFTGSFGHHDQYAVTEYDSLAIAGEIEWPPQYGMAAIRPVPLVELRLLHEYPDPILVARGTIDTKELFLGGLPFRNLATFRSARGSILSHSMDF